MAIGWSASPQAARSPRPRWPGASRSAFDSSPRGSLARPDMSLDEATRPRRRISSVKLIKGPEWRGALGCGATRFPSPAGGAPRPLGREALHGLAGCRPATSNRSCAARPQGEAGLPLARSRPDPAATPRSRAVDHRPGPTSAARLEHAAPRCRGPDGFPRQRGAWQDEAVEHQGRVRLKDVAAAAGLSSATVSLILNGMSDRFPPRLSSACARLRRRSATRRTSLRGACGPTSPTRWAS